MSCSKAKKARGGKAVDVYDGPAFRSLRKAQHAGIFPDLFIISAKYGLLEGRSLIEPYDQRLPPSPSDEFTESLRRELANRIDWAHYDSVFLFLGPAYERAVGDVAHYLPRRTEVHRAEGAIGVRLHALKAWLWSLRTGATA